MIHTIGHSNHSLQHFTTLLQSHGVDAIADVRSTPYSRFNPQFRRENLARALETIDIQYHFLGEEFGARSPDPACYDTRGRVVYARLAAGPAFQRGLQELERLMETRRVALMCAEREPLECHRTILVARELERRGVAIAHILADGGIEPHAHAMERLIAELKLAESDLFDNPQERLEQAYDAQSTRIAYVKPGKPAAPKPRSKR